MYSTGGADFSMLADIKPKGSHSAYHFMNDLTSQGNSFYKLKMTDLDGSVTYSPVVNITCGTTGSKITVGLILSVLLKVFLKSMTSGPASMELYNPHVKMLSRRLFQLQEGDNQYIYDGTGNLPEGPYYLRITYQDKTEYFKLLKGSG